MSFNKRITFQIEADDKASAKLKSLQGEVSKIGKAYGGISQSISNFGKSFQTELNLLKKATQVVSAGVVGLAGATALAAKRTVSDSMKMENALTGLTTVARAFKESEDEAKQAAVDLSKDGLMTVTEAANGLKNLLASKFSLPEAIRLMNAFKDSASFNRQAALGFGEAIVGATEGIKNQNSILVDNAGITKNLSIILKEAGYSQQDLANVTTDVGVRQALYNGLLEEASVFQGDAGRASDTLTGQLSMLDTSIFNLSASIGDQLKPYVSALVSEINKWILSVTGSGSANEAVEKLIGKIKEWVESMGGKEGIQAKLQEAWKTIRDEVVPAILTFMKVTSEIIQRIWEWRDVIIPLIALYEGIKVAMAGAAIIRAFASFGAMVTTAVGQVGLLSGALAMLPSAIGISVAIYGVTKVIQALQEINTNIGITESNIDKIGKKAQELEEKRKKAKENGNDELAQSYKEQILAISKNLKNIGETQARASGGPVSAGSPYIVGEQGPEFFVPNQSGTIIPNNQMGMTIIIDLRDATITDETLISRLKQTIGRELELSRYGIG